jgi:hypothetical protein
MEGLVGREEAVRAWGCEIHVADRGLRLVDRGTWGIAFAVILLSCAGLSLLVGAFVVLCTSGEADLLTGIPILLGLSAVLLSSAGFLYRTYRYRSDRSEHEIVRTLIVDVSDGTLKDLAGHIVARLVDVRVVVRTDGWWTRGLARAVNFIWPGGRRVVFRSLSRSKIATVLRTLNHASVGSSQPPLCTS